MIKIEALLPDRGTNHPSTLGVCIQLKTDPTRVLLDVISAPADLGKKAAPVLCLNLEGLVSAEIPAKDKAPTAFCDVRRKNSVGKESSVLIHASNKQGDLQTDSLGAATTS
jgi:hypothetical protein